MTNMTLPNTIQPAVPTNSSTEQNLIRSLSLTTAFAVVVVVGVVVVVVVVVVVSRNRYSPHHILWYSEYKTTDKYMIRLSNRFRYRYTNTFI